MTACFGAKVVGAHADQQGSQRIAIHGLGEWFDDFAISLKWWTGNVMPDTRRLRRKLAGVPKIEVVEAVQGEVEETFWGTVTATHAANEKSHHWEAPPVMSHPSEAWEVGGAPGCATTRLEPPASSLSGPQSVRNSVVEVLTSQTKSTA